MISTFDLLRATRDALLQIVAMLDNAERHGHRTDGLDAGLGLAIADIEERMALLREEDAA